MSFEHLQSKAANYYGALGLPAFSLAPNYVGNAIEERVGVLQMSGTDVQIKTAMAEMAVLLLGAAAYEGFDLLTEVEAVLANPKTRIIP